MTVQLILLPVNPSAAVFKYFLLQIIQDHILSVDSCTNGDGMKTETNFYGDEMEDL